MENKVISLHTTTVQAQPSGYAYPSPSGRHASSLVAGKSGRPIKVEITSDQPKKRRKSAH
jgi:hypothetical protein